MSDSAASICECGHFVTDHDGASCAHCECRGYITTADRREQSLPPDPPAASEREWLRPVLDAENALSQAIYLADFHAEKLSRDHPSGPDFVTHYVVAHGLWGAVLRERQNLRHAIQTTCWPDRRPA